MKNIKKTEVITFRTDKVTKAKLEVKAEKRKWSKSQLSEEIVNNHINAKENILKFMSLSENEERTPETFKITKSETDIILSIAEMLDYDTDKAMSFIIQYVGINWPF